MIERVDDARCWGLVAAMGHELVAARLEEVLEPLSQTELDAFCYWLDRVTAALNTPAHRAEAGYAFELPSAEHVVRPWDAPAMACPADVDELRATVVAHGKDAWEAVVAEPGLLGGGWPTGLGRQLRRAVSDAVDRQLRHRSPV